MPNYVYKPLVVSVSVAPITPGILESDCLDQATPNQSLLAGFEVPEILFRVRSMLHGTPLRVREVVGDPDPDGAKAENLEIIKTFVERAFQVLAGPSGPRSQPGRAWRISDTTVAGEPAPVATQNWPIIWLHGADMVSYELRTKPYDASTNRVVEGARTDPYREKFALPNGKGETQLKFWMSFMVEG